MAQDIQNIKSMLNKVSPSFCIAKWSSVTIHFEGGTTHSCHHPKVHKISAEEISQNPAALHNTKYKIEQRRKMIIGERPSECEYCWRMEDLQATQTSDRHLKSAADWSYNQIDEIVTDPYNVNYIPRYVEVSFSHTCQFKCSYCSAEHSTAWEEELRKFGNYPNNTGRKINATIVEEKNPYVEAFWKWWPHLRSQLHTFRITGGEPLLSPNTFRVLEELLKNPQPNLSLGINSNLGAPRNLIDRFINLIIQLEANNCVREIIIFPSIDAHGAQAEYIRHGLKYQYFWDNITKIFENTSKVQMTLMCTFNALSVTSFEKLFDKVVEVNRLFRSSKIDRPMLIDVSYLRYPEHQSVKVLPNEYNEKMASLVAHIEKNTDLCMAGKPFYELELLKIKRILEYMREPITQAEKRKLQNHFYEFFLEHDRRRNVSFLKSFPEMESFWLICYRANRRALFFNYLRRLDNSFNEKIAKYNNLTNHVFYKFLHFLIYKILYRSYYFLVYKLLLKPVYFLEYLFVVRLKWVKSTKLKSLNPRDYKK